MEDTSHFGVVDYVALGLVLAVSALIGIYYRFSGGKQQTAEEYFMANKGMSSFPVACSLMATYMSAIGLLGESEESYTYGTQYVTIIFGYLIGSLLVALLYLPVFFKLQKLSTFEYLELRFGKISRRIASCLCICRMVLYTSIALYAPALALSATTGISETASILSIGLICTFYSTIGGMKAVLWTDVFQSFLIYSGMLAVIIKGTIDSQGISNVWKTAKAGKRIGFLDVDPNPATRCTLWTQIAVGTFAFLDAYGISQGQVQKLLTVKSLRKSQIAVFLNYPIVAFLTLTTSFSGLVIYSKYHNCDPVLSSRISSSDQLLPIFVVDSLTKLPGLAGLVVSGIFAASLSTISSSVNSLTAIAIEDFIKPVMASRWQNSVFVSVVIKALAGVIGVILIGLAFVVGQLGSVLQVVLAFSGIIGGPLVAFFSLGMFCPRVTQRGAILGFITGIAFCSWIYIGARIEKPYDPKLSTSAIGCLSTSNDTDLYTSAPHNVISTESDFTHDPSSALYTFYESSSSFQNAVTSASPKDSLPENIFYLYRISFMLYSSVGFFITMIVGMLASLFEKKRHVNPDLLSPICQYWCSKTNALDGDLHKLFEESCETIPR